MGGNGGLIGGLMEPLFGSPQQAAAPDYTKAAQATAAGNLEAARYATDANRINQYNPYGSLTYNKEKVFDEVAYNNALNSYNKALAEQQRTGGGWADISKRFGLSNQGDQAVAPDKSQFTTDKWTQTTSFTPQGQQLFDLQQASDLAYGQAARKGFENIRGLFENPNIDESKLTAMPMNQGVNSQAAIMSRLRPTLDQEQAALDAKLANQGIALGSDAYKRAMNLQAQRMNDLELQAARQGIELDMNARQQGLNEQYQRMQQPLNLVNALKTGSQVQAPQFQSYAQQATTAGPDMMGAANAQYGANLDVANAQNARSNAMISGLFSMGAAAAGKMSDRRLKKNIKLVGKTEGGTNIYSYNYVWGGPTEFGVMAQEVEKDNPQAVFEIAGYKGVDYSKVK